MHQTKRVIPTEQTWLGWLSLSACLVIVASCQPAPPPQADVGTTPLSCLEDFASNRLSAVLERCNAMVDSMPGQPEPLRDRALVLSLNGQHDRACSDVEQAKGLLTAASDPMLRHELTVRQATCKQRRSIAGKD
ncbi:MAG: hypothetical protein VKJ63_01380 [Synechococcus sp.]|nr:hypothetical protein [Synechococcus sp.]